MQWFPENKYQESACQAEIEALRNCCKKWSKESGCCAGVKLEENDQVKDKAHVPVSSYFWVCLCVYKDMHK